MGRREGESFFRRVSRYPDGSKSTPRENRLTEALAALLQFGDPELAFELLGLISERFEPELVTSRSQGDRLRVETQVYRSTAPNSSGRTRHAYIDLLLSGRDGWAIAVEVKHGAKESGDQFDLYVKLVGNLVVLAPARDLAELQRTVPSGSAVVSWEELAHLIKRFKQQGDIGKWLQDQFIKFLEEEKLMESDPIGRDELAVWKHHLKAAAALENVLRHAVNHVTNSAPSADPSAAQTKTTKRETFRFGSWWQFPQFGAPQGMWLEFKVCGPDDLPELEGAVARSELMFIAGLSAKNGVDLGAIAKKLDDGGAEGFHAFTEGRCARLMRVSSPAERFTEPGRSIQQQGIELGEWVLQAFRNLESLA